MTKVSFIRTTRLLSGSASFKFKILHQELNIQTDFFSLRRHMWAIDVSVLQFPQLVIKENSLAVFLKGYLLKLFMSADS